MPCVAGRFSDNDESAFCVLCPADQISQNEGATSCTACPPGKTANANRTTCIASDEDGDKEGGDEDETSDGRSIHPRHEKSVITAAVTLVLSLAAAAAVLIIMEIMV